MLADGRGLALALVVLALAGCGDDDGAPTEDAGASPIDASPIDASPFLDSAVLDAGPHDAASLDGGGELCTPLPGDYTPRIAMSSTDEWPPCISDLGAYALEARIYPGAAADGSDALRIKYFNPSTARPPLPWRPIDEAVAPISEVLEIGAGDIEPRQPQGIVLTEPVAVPRRTRSGRSTSARATRSARTTTSARVGSSVVASDLVDLIDRPTGKLSAGQKTRVSLAKALLNCPEVLLLDEPTASLDPDTADWVRTHLENYRKERSATVLLASHNMLEVERLCERVIMMKRGKIVDDDSPGRLLARYGRENLEDVFLDIARGRRQSEAAQ